MISISLSFLSRSVRSYLFLIKVHSAVALSSQLSPHYTSNLTLATMAMLLKDATEVTKDLLAHLHDPDFNDVKIEALDGDVPANKTIISMRSQYFKSMFSANNNFVESSTGTVKLPYPKVVVEKAVTYLYSGG